MNIEPGRKYTYQVEPLQFGNIPRTELIRELSSGRICGVLLESDCAYRFDNLSKHGCAQGAGEDLRLIVDGEYRTVQAKTVQLSKSYRGRGRDRQVDPSAPIGWTTKSGLWDSGRGTKRIAEEWDIEHEIYMTKYDYFLYINIDSFPTVNCVLVPAAKLAGRSEVCEQAHDYHYGRSGRKAVPAWREPGWRFPIHITRGMWDEFCGTVEINVTDCRSTD